MRFEDIELDGWYVKDNPKVKTCLTALFELSRLKCVFKNERLALLEQYNSNKEVVGQSLHCAREEVYLSPSTDPFMIHEISHDQVWVEHPIFAESIQGVHHVIVTRCNEFVDEIHTLDNDGITKIYCKAMFLHKFKFVEEYDKLQDALDVVGKFYQPLHQRNLNSAMSRFEGLFGENKVKPKFKDGIGYL